MGVIHYESKFEHHDIEVMVDQRSKGDCRGPWEIISLDVGNVDRMTPKELRRLGRWLQQEGKHIGREFKSNGARKEQGVSAT